MTAKPPISLAVLILAAPAFGQSSISTERPSFSSSPFALDAGFWQIEGGYQYTQNTNDVDSQSVPLLLLRYGTSERMEVQLSWTGYNKVDLGSTMIDGVSDMSIGVKWQLSDDDATTPIALFAGASLPVGDRNFTSDEVDPVVGMFWAHNGPVALFGTVLVSESDNERVVGNAIGINLPISERCNACSAYIEYFGIHVQNNGPQHNINAGVSLLYSNDLQFDVNLGIGLNNRAPDGYVGIGAAYRF